MPFTPHITAVLGATNTGKTHYAVERMCARTSGVIGLPLRLLAREVYDKICAEKGKTSCALLTGEEKIIPPHARYFVCTVEAMPMDDILAGKFTCVIIDEVQMMAHKERGHIFTDRVLYARGTEETLLLGADTVRALIKHLVPTARFVTRERFSTLSYAGHCKLSALPKRTVIVAFSASEVYALAELMRRYYGGCALVMGGLSPRTRNAQADLYRSGEVDYLVATDAIGMGLNLDVNHVAFASLRKFDGQRKRYLHAHEIAQIAGRAGRFRNDGSFGTTGSCLALDDDIIGRIENHHFTPLEYVEWRNANLDFSTLENLQNSLALAPHIKGLRRIAPAPDELALEKLIRLDEVTDFITQAKNVKRLWDICQIPDFRNLGSEAHARLLEEIFLNLAQNDHKLPHTYIENNIQRLDHIEGSVEILSSRLSFIRTWTYISNKKSWIDNPNNWVKRTKGVESGLSDALHSKLVARFVDHRTSVLLKGIGANIHMDVIISSTGEVQAEGYTIGQLKGLLFTPSETKGELDEKTVNAAAALALGPEVDRRLTQITGSEHSALVLSDRGEILWNTDPIAKLVKGTTLLAPDIEILGGALGSPVLQEQALGRLRDFIRTEITQKFESLLALKTFTEDENSFQGARALAHVLYENHGLIVRLKHLQLIKDTDKEARGYLRNMSVQIGFHHVFLRDMLKPAAARLLSLIFAFAWDQDGGGASNPFLPANGMSSTPDDSIYSEATLNKAGYTRVGPRIIRVDILARLAQMLMQATNASDNKQFRIAQEMMALLGCGHDDFEGVLTALGYKKITKELDENEFEAEKAALDKFIQMIDAQSTAKTTAPTEAKATKKSPWETSLNTYRQKPETAEDGTIPYPKTIDYWQYDFPKRKFKQSPKDANHQNRKFANDKGKFRKPKAKPKGKRPEAPRQKPMNPEDSPFAALASLNLSPKKK